MWLTAATVIVIGGLTYRAEADAAELHNFAIPSDTDGNQERMTPGGLECWRIGQFMAQWGKLREGEGLKRNQLHFADDWSEAERRDLNAIANAFWNNDYYGFKQLISGCKTMPRA